ncbi:hypothetical protein [Rubripirellula lacrimiformis]|uniref:hypothetical protein n=1 Tax=Rubripirellula lacrimiformis TaxID=1930273 RepID=UPI001C54C469|nr:hypothetical protein [Rubripirellula lacrimiformis]
MPVSRPHAGIAVACDGLAWTSQGGPEQARWAIEPLMDWHRTPVYLSGTNSSARRF